MGRSQFGAKLTDFNQQQLTQILTATGALTTAVDDLQGAVDALEALVNGISGAVGDVETSLTGALSSVETSLSGALSSAQSVLASAIAGIDLSTVFEWAAKVSVPFYYQINDGSWHDVVNVTNASGGLAGVCVQGGVDSTSQVQLYVNGSLLSDTNLASGRLVYGGIGATGTLYADSWAFSSPDFIPYSIGFDTSFRLRVKRLTGSSEVSVRGVVLS